MIWFIFLNLIVNRRLFNLTSQLRELVISELEREHHFPEPKMFFVFFSLCKATRTGDAVATLCRKGLGEDAAILSRSLFDLAVTVLFVLQDSTDSRINKWMDNDWIIRAKRYNYASSNPALSKVLEKRARLKKRGDDTIRKIQVEAKKVKEADDYSRKSWSGKTFLEMAREVGKEEQYNTVYGPLSDLEHSSTRVVNDYVKSSRTGHYTASDGKSRKNMEFSLIVSFENWSIIVEEYNKIAKVGWEEDLKRVVDRFKRVVNKLNGSY